MVFGRVKRMRTSKKGAGSKTVPKVNSTPASRMAKLRPMKFKQTRWADHDLLRTLNIYDEVENIFMNMGLIGLFHMAELAHKNESHQFLATLSFYDDTALHITNENRGVLSFKINGQEYNITVAQICLAYQFNNFGRAFSISLDKNEAQNVWSLIADGVYDKGMSKSSMIRHPAIRYAHKLLANTLFSRRETGAVKEEELALLIQGIKPFLRTTATNWEIVGFPEPIHFGHYFVRRLLQVQEWITTNEDSTPALSCGGMITPILRACGVELRNAEGCIERIDATYLASARMLVGRLRNSYGYQFTLQTEKKIIVLPHQSITRFTTRDNLLFAPRDFLLYDSRKDGRFTGIPKKSAASTATEDEQEAEAQTEKIIGIRRYDFMPYGEPVSGSALHAAHEHIGKLRRLGKWHTKLIKKLVKTAKRQGKLIKEQGRLIKDLMNRKSASSQEDEDRALAVALSMAESEEAAEASTQRQGKQTAPLSPSSNDSDNPSYSIDSSSPSP